MVPVPVPVRVRVPVPVPVVVVVPVVVPVVVVKSGNPPPGDRRVPENRLSSDAGRPDFLN